MLKTAEPLKKQKFTKKNVEENSMFMFGFNPGSMQGPTVRVAAYHLYLTIYAVQWL